MTRISIYANFSKEAFDKTSKEANKTAIEMSGDEGKDDLQYGNIALIPDAKQGISFDERKNTLTCCGDLFVSNDCDELKEKLGYMSIDIPFDSDMVIEIIEAYRKKLGKLKTILEASKD